eukprot:6193841-Pleurochrysis_carterae.AAC.1
MAHAHLIQAGATISCVYAGSLRECVLAGLVRVTAASHLPTKNQTGGSAGRSLGTSLARRELAFLTLIYCRGTMKPQAICGNKASTEASSQSQLRAAAYSCVRRAAGCVAYLKAERDRFGSDSSYAADTR